MPAKRIIRYDALLKFGQNSQPGKRTSVIAAAAA
jgi:hypothetical protein